MRALSLKKESYADLTPAELAGVQGGAPITGDRTGCLLGVHHLVDRLILAYQSRECIAVE